jgi:NADPH2:quinone reductase
MRLGLAEGVTFPRVPGVEAVGVVAECPSGEFSEGQQVAAFAGGMGRAFDGGYAEYCCVPAARVVPFRGDLDWTTLGAIPVMLQTASGALTIGLDAKEGQSLLIRGGTSSVGMATAVLARRLGMRVLSTTRQEGKVRAYRAPRSASRATSRPRPAPADDGQSHSRRYSDSGGEDGPAYLGPPG